MGQADYYLRGSWSAICDRCGRKLKAKDLRKTWDGLMCCETCWEPRHPQDFVRGVQDQQSPPWTRPPPAPVFAVLQCSLPGRSAVPILAIPGCSIPSLIPSGIFLESLPYYGNSAIPQLFIPGFAHPGDTTMTVTSVGGG